MTQKEDYSLLVWAGGVLTLAVVLVFGLYGVVQPMRMYATGTALEHEAIERGEETWEHDCVTCHGVHGEGVLGSGPALNTQEFLAAAPDELIYNTITDGRPGTSMPAWGQSRGGPYNAQTVDDLVTLIRSWEATAPSEADIVYEADPVHGAVLFSTTCFACHGVAGEGTSIGLALNDAESLARYDDGYYRDVIARGRPDRGMPTWGTVLSPNEIEDLVAYVRTWEMETPQATAQLGGDVANGRTIFESTCVVCHGAQGEGSDVAPPLAGEPILSDHQALYDTISHGRLEDGMPNWGQVLSPAEINDVIAYLGTLGAEGEQAVVEEPAEPDWLGEAHFLFIRECASCHGMLGEGTEDKPALAGNEFIQSSDDAAIANVIMNGRTNTAMEGFSSVLSGDELDLIIQLLHHWQ